MSSWDLPTQADIGGEAYSIRSDYRAVLDVMQVLADPDLTDGERVATSLTVFFEDPDSIPLEHLQEAINWMVWFVGGGEDQSSGARKPRLMDWEQDFPLIVAPINRVLGEEVRSVPYMHWWTFLAAYREIGDCTFAQVVSIRQKRMEGKKLDVQEKRFYRDHPELVNLKRVTTADEDALINEWTSTNTATPTEAQNG